MDFSLRLLKDPTEAEVAEAVEALDRAFGGEYLLETLGGDTSLVKPCIKVNLDQALFARAGEIWVAEAPGLANANAEKTIVGVAIFRGPEIEPEAGEGECWKQFLKTLPDSVAGWWGEFLNTYGEYCDRSYGVGFKRTSYHLDVLGVVPEYQKKGIGRSLIRNVEERAKEDHAAVCLDTIQEINVPYYRSLGFEVKEPTTIQLLDSKQTLSLWGFFKHPEAI